MNLYNGELCSVLRARINEAIDGLENGAYGDLDFIDEVYAALGRTPPVAVPSAEAVWGDPYDDDDPDLEYAEAYIDNGSWLY